MSVGSFINKKDSDDVVPLRETCLVIHDQALEIDARLEPYINFSIKTDILPNMGSILQETIKRCYGVIEPTIGLMVLHAYATECIDRYSKWSARYNNHDYYHTTLAEIAKYLKPELLVDQSSRTKLLDMFFYDNGPLPLHDVSATIRDIMMPCDGWAILFCKIKNGLLIIEDYGDFRIHQWEAKDGVQFRRKRGLLPARSILR